MYEKVMELIREKGWTIRDKWGKKYTTGDDKWFKHMLAEVVEYEVDEERILELCDRFHPSNFSAFMSIMYLEMKKNFKTHMISQRDNIPTIKIYRHAYLAWFRGYRMQVSGDANGNGCYGNSDTTMKTDLQACRKLESCEEWQKIILWSHVLEATSRYENFINTPTEIVNEFMNKTAKFNNTAEFTDFDVNNLPAIITDATDDELCKAKFDRWIVTLQEGGTILQDLENGEYGLFEKFYLGTDFVAIGNKKIKLPTDFIDEDFQFTDTEKSSLLVRFAIYLMWSKFVSFNQAVHKPVDEVMAKQTEEKKLTELQRIYDMAYNLYPTRHEMDVF